MNPVAIREEKRSLSVYGVSLVVMVGIFCLIIVAMVLGSSDEVSEDLFMAGLAGAFHKSPDQVTKPSKPEFCDNEARLERVNHFCKSKHWTTGRTEKRSFFYRRLLTDDTHKVIFCLVPYVASSSIKNMFIKANGKAVDKNKFYSDAVLKSFGIRYLDDYDLDTIDEKLSGYHKVMAVMDPLKRLNVTFQHTALSKYLTQKYASVIHKHFPNVTKTPKGNLDVNFSQFVEMVGLADFNDIRWQSFYELCHPCDIEYDRIIKIDSFWDDIKPMLELLSSEKAIEPLYTEIKQKEISRAQSALSTFDNVDSSLVSKMLNRFERDMTLFGYSWSYIYGSECKSGSLDNFQCC